MHQVNKAGLERLLVLVEGCHWLNRGRQEMPSGLRTPSKEVVEASTESVANSTSEFASETKEVDNAAAGGVAVANSACSPPPLGAFSERHVYKYRCGQCSLAFRSQAKLELHAQYHQIRNTTRCRLCQRNFRSVQALLKHVETGHTEQTEDTERYRLSLMTHPLLMAGQFDQPASGRPEEMEEDAMEEEETAEAKIDEDEEGKGAANDNDCQPPQQVKDVVSVGPMTGTLRPLPYSLDKYMDPKRPFKCDICKESFTQKNILLVHFNSVSHLHKVKKIMTAQGGNNNLLLTPQSEKGSASPASNSSPNNSNSGPGSTLLSVLGSLNARKQLLEPDMEAKPYKCNICQVAYSQGSTLDIHIRSVVHRSRASCLQDLVMSGQVDLSRPLIEQPDQETVDELQKQHLNSFLSPKSLSSSLSEQKTPPNHQLAQVGREQDHEDPQPLSSSTPKSLMEAFDKQPSGRAADSSFNSSFLQQTSGSPSFSQADTSSSPPSVCQSEASAELQSTEDRRPSSQILNFLQNYGFELVMQFNEKHQKNGAEQKEIVKDETEQDGDKADMSEQSKEVPRSPGVCPFCSEQFPGFWPLKEHIEEKHGKVVPAAIVQNYLSVLKANVTSDHKADEKDKSEKKIDEVESSKPQIQDNDTSHGDPVPVASSVTDPSKVFKPDDIIKLMTGITGASSSLSPVMNLHPPLMPAGLFSPAALFHSQAANQQLHQHQHQQLQHQQQTTSFENQIFAKLGIDPEIVRQAGLDPKLLIHLASVDPKAALDPRLLAMFSTAALPPPPHQHHQHQQLAATNHKMMQLALESKLAAGGGGLTGFPPPPPTDMKQQYLDSCQRRARTRISDDQLRILRANFDINNSPAEEQVAKLTQETGLPPKVIKHWFRNTLFKERQKNKDSPYNFNNPPSTLLNLEEYEKTGKSKVIQLNEEEQKQYTEGANHKQQHQQEEEDKEDKKGSEVDDSGDSGERGGGGEEDRDSIVEIKRDPDVGGGEEEAPRLEELRKLQLSLALRVSVSPDNMSLNSHSYDGLFSPQVV